MNRFRAAAFAVTLAVTSIGTAVAQQPAAQAPADAMTDPTSFKRDEVLAFIGVKPGDKVADIISGRFARAISAAVGEHGKLYAVEPDEVVKERPQVVSLMNAVAAQAPGHNVEVVTGPINQIKLPSELDAVFIRQNYHDLHDKFMGPADVPAFNRAVYAALKPGGVFVVLDHSASKGSGLAATDTLHRIDRDAVVSEVTAAGFRLDAESKMFANPADARTKIVFDPSIRGHTDQFLLRFKKPG